MSNDSVAIDLPDEDCPLLADKCVLPLFVDALFYRDYTGVAVVLLPILRPCESLRVPRSVQWVSGIPLPNVPMSVWGQWPLCFAKPIG